MDEATSTITTSQNTLKLPHGELQLPAFLPDATVGVVRSLDAQDLEQCGIQALVMNAFHLMQRPGSSTVSALGGIHRMSGWQRPIFTDSGGFQAYSLIRANSKYGSISDRGLIFYPEGSQRKLKLTPEKTIQLQMGYGADLLFCLDDCTNAEDSLDVQEVSVKRTIAWAKRCKAEFVRLLEQKKIDLNSSDRPLLFAVLQGGGSFELRRECAEALLEIGFDGYGFGGWPLDQHGNLLTDILAFCRSLIPKQFPMHALGIGHPQNVLAVARMGYELFDCVMPTRDARHGRLYAFTRELDDLPEAMDSSWFSYVYAQDKKHIKANQAIAPFCDASCCQRYSLGYLHHLFNINDTLYYRLATIHNLRFMARLMELLRKNLRRDQNI
ncbi:tRNA-guanine transglycosylase, various specificities [Thalassoporum mexicanum PCC 7367]|uniref:tRNA-ribosyltransferase family protein n=1 Tax=Thalassoporum mexicanum TaxID=3457544 RepID=UPI00029FE751|nr:tRNA guanosine(34) transglycosylase Tgt [Pseudanabaena sp. PCC 7367]AFY69324.1 tRNA-guanine transglycosylase, various specificities [Pseudanabaena sp. PCC 7367]